MKGIQRIISGWLAICMVFSMLPVQVFATETEPAMENVAAETVPEETAAETTAPTEAPTAHTEAEPEPTVETVAPIEETVESRLSEEAMNADTTASGTCGENLTWTLDSEGVLTISGTGAMAAGSTWPERGLTSVIIEEGVTSISRAAFYWNQDLISVSIPSTLTHIDTDAFYGCPNLKNVYISDIAAWCNIRFVGLFSNPFYYASYMYLNGELLKDLVIPETVTKLNNYVFMGATNLETVTIPESVTYVGYDAFRRCSSLADIYYAGDEARWKYISADCGYDAEQITVHYGIPNSSGTYGENVTWFHDSATGTLTVSGTGAVPNTHYSEHTPWYYIRDSITAIAVDEGITSIGNVFRDCVKAEVVQLPSTLKEIGGSAFGRCTLLTSIDIPEGVEKIGIGAFAECSNLPRVVIPSGMTDIGEEVFRDCEKLTDVSLPEGMTEIPEAFFEGCTALSTITLPQSVECIGGYAFGGCSSLQEIQLPEKLKSIGNGAFGGCSSLQEIKLPEKLESIGDEIFYGCTSLTSITVPQNVTKIEDWAFYGCTSLTSITVPQNVTTIGDWAFYGCTSLTSITLPKSLSVITNSAFGNCNALTDVYYTGTEEQWATLLASMDPEYNAPLFNEELQVHCNWITESEEPEEPISGCVLYYHSWERNTNTLFFGADGEIGFLVTEETDVSSISDLFLGRYVLIETKEVDGQEILLNMVLPKTATGTVTAVNATQITIDGDTYSIAAEVSVPETYLNKQVVYHIAYNQLVGIDIMKEKDGYLTHWHSGGRQLRIQSNAASSDYKYYHLSDLADDSESFLSWSVNENGQTDVTVTYLTDNNRVVYQIQPVIERREHGFSAEKHGWPFINNRFCFGYDKDDTTPFSAYLNYYPNPVVIVRSVFSNAVGNCFGMSLLALAEYLGKIDLEPYFPDKLGHTLNEYGYESIERVQNNTENLYVIKGNEEIISKIESASVSQATLEIFNAREFQLGSYDAVLAHLSDPDPVPLLVSLDDARGFCHAVVTDTTYKPIYIGNGIYAVICYDPNSPRLVNEIEEPCYVYNNIPSYLLLNTKDTTWTYVFNGEIGPVGTNLTPNGINYINVNRLSNEFFEGNFSYKEDDITVVYGATDVTIKSKDGEVLFVIENNVATLVNDNIEYFPYCNENENEVISSGIVYLPKDDYLFMTEGNSSVKCISDGNLFSYTVDEDAEVALSFQSDTINIDNYQNELLNFEYGFINSDSSICTVVDGALSADESISVIVKQENKTVEVKTNNNAKTISVEQFIDGDETENTTDTIHYHNDLSFMEGVAATCTEPGLVDHYVCKCGMTFADQKAYEILKNVDISPKGHSEETVPGKTAACSTPGLTEGKTCSACGEITIEQTVIPAKGHIEVINKAIAATCTKTGLTEGKHCSVCNAVLVAQETIAALGHKWTTADCDTPKTCSVCKATEGKVLGHSYDDNVDGTCNSCGVNRETVESRQVTHMLRMYNPYTGEHFYTGSVEEKDNLVAVGWNYEGVAFTFPSNTGAPVHRLYDPVTGEHLYTMNEEEKATLEDAGWNYGGIAFNSAYDTEAVQHRLHNPYATVGAYHFTFSDEEKQNLINAGWEYQGIGWYSCWK